MVQTNENGNRNKNSISTDGKEEADRLFTGLSEGGQIEGSVRDLTLVVLRHILY